MVQPTQQGGFAVTLAASSVETVVYGTRQPATVDVAVIVAMGLVD